MFQAKVSLAASHFYLKNLSLKHLLHIPRKSSTVHVDGVWLEFLTPVFPTSEYVTEIVSEGFPIHKYLPLILRGVTPWDPNFKLAKSYFLHVVPEETEAQSKKVTCSRS